MSSSTRTLLMDFLNLPQFETMGELSQLTRLSSRLLYCLSKQTEKYYKVKSIPKHNGELREISIPSYTLHIIQRWILKEILNKVAPSNRAMAYRKGNDFGHKQNAFYHAHTLYGLSLDLEDFFPSISSNKVYTVFSNMGYNNFASTILTNLCTLNGKLPQGSACSPALSNIICITLDKRLIGLCEKRGIRYSRYADDMYFSCDDKVLLLKTHPIISKIIEDEGFVINARKTHFHTPSNRKQITGVTVVPTNQDDNMELKAPRKIKQLIRTEIHSCLVSGNYEKREHIIGEIAYVSYLEKENKTPYSERIKRYIEKLTSKIQVFPELVEAYNENKFFQDLDTIASQDLHIEDEDDFEFFAVLFEDRKRFLAKKGLKDICQYDNWPSVIISPQQNDSGYSDIDSPF